MIAEIVFGFRESFEAAIIVSILFSTLLKLKRRDMFGTLWLGVALALAASSFFALAFIFLGSSLGESGLFESLSAIAAVSLITYLVLLFRNPPAARIDKRAADSLRTGTFGLLAFVSVFREGIELSLMLFSVSALSFSSFYYSLAGVFIGSLAGVLLYVAFRKYSFRRVFGFTNILLVLIAAGLLSSAVSGFQEEGIFPVFLEKVWDVSWILSSDGFPGLLFAALFSYDPSPSLLQAASFFTYLAAMSFMAFRAGRKDLYMKHNSSIK